MTIDKTILAADVVEPMFLREMQNRAGSMTILPNIVSTGRGGSRKDRLHYAGCPNVAKTDRFYVRPVWARPMSGGGHRVYTPATCCFGGRVFHPDLT